MIRFRGRRVLLDIEGTTSDIAFVRDVLFPYAHREVGAFLTANSADPAVGRALEQMARDAGTAGVSEWCPAALDPASQRAWVCAEVRRLIEADSKQTGLKALQGLIWEAGSRDGTLRAHVYPEVPNAFARWRQAGVSLAIYSSGSIAAQKLFFRHTIAGDLTHHLSGYFDTTSGPKRSADSYRRILEASALSAADVLFLSDIPEELDAARLAGLSTGLVVRPGNAPVAQPTHPVVTTLDDIEVDGSASA
jgi:enolase-phosphatase E1